MSNRAIRVTNVGKQYRLGTYAPYQRFSESLTNWLAAPYRLWKKQASDSQTLSLANTKQKIEYIWALNDISFDVTQGEVIGIIGLNGAGKSTLLKILSRITEPTKGRVEFRGRVASLLEVGTGFHPELTGRENTFLSGAVLGMRRSEVKRKFDEIVDFAEIDTFIDTPVKRYSSGMQMRLAFAVAAHLDPEILLVDEVLAVGDIAFQKKCLGKMGDVAASKGRTVLFVSHNMGTIQQLCSRCLLLTDGRLAMDGPTGAVVSEYLRLGLATTGERVWSAPEEAPGDEYARLHAIRVTNSAGAICTEFDLSEPVCLQMHYWVQRDVDYLDASFYFYNEKGELIFISIDDALDATTGNRRRPAGLYRSTCRIPANLLNNGRIYVRASLSSECIVHTSQHDVVTFTMIDSMKREGARGNYHAGEWPASSVRPKLEWNTQVSTLETETQHRKVA